MLTVPMLLDWIDGASSSFAYSRLTQNDFAWVKSYAADAPIDTVDAEDVLVYESAELSDRRQAESPLSIVLVKDALPPRDTIPENTLYVKTKLSKAAFVQVLQKRMLDIFEWQNQLNRVMMREEGYQRLIDVSENILGNFVTLTDSVFRLLAYTQHLTIDDERVNELISLGYHGKVAIEQFRAGKAMVRWQEQRGSKYTESGAYTKYPFVNRVFKVNGSYYMQMVMTCNNREYTQGLMDLFDILANQISAYIRRFEPIDTRSFTRETTFLVDVITGHNMSNDLLEAQAKRFSMPIDEPYRLYSIMPNNDSAVGFSEILQKANARLPLHYVVPFENQVLILAHRRRGFECSDDRQTESLLLSFCDLSQMKIAVSGLIPSLSYANMGFRQVQIAFEHGGPLSYAPDRPMLYYFEMNLLRYLVTADTHSTEFLRYSVRNSTVGLIEADDARNHTHDSEILHSYLVNQCHCSETARELGMHRNTVANRIAILQDRYAADFSNALLCQNLLTIYSARRFLGIK